MAYLAGGVEDCRTIDIDLLLAEGSRSAGRRISRAERFKTGLSIQDFQLSARFRAEVALPVRPVRPESPEWRREFVSYSCLLRSFGRLACRAHCGSGPLGRTVDNRRWDYRPWTVETASRPKLCLGTRYESKIIDHKFLPHL